MLLCGGCCFGDRHANKPKIVVSAVAMGIDDPGDAVEGASVCGDLVGVPISTVDVDERLVVA